MPVVPRIEIPPTSPSRSLIVCLAISSPPGTLRITSAPRSWQPASSSSTIAIRLRRGIGVMASAPTSSPSPGLVTWAIPGPPWISMPASGLTLDLGDELGPVGAVGVVAGVLDHAADGPAPEPLAPFEGEGHATTVGQGRLDLRQQCIANQATRRRLGGRRGTRSRRVAGSQALLGLGLRGAHGTLR